MTVDVSPTTTEARSLLARAWTRWDRWWLAPMPFVALGALRIVTYATLLWFLASEYAWVVRLETVDPWLYRPILVFELLNVGPIPSGIASTLHPVLIVCAVLGLVGVLARTCSIVCAVGYLYSIGQVYSFSNVHHGDGLLGLVLIVLALSPSGEVLAIHLPGRRAERTAGGPSRPGPGWPIRFVRVQIAVVYFLAGYAKLVLSGPSWMDGASLQHYLILRGQPIGYWLAAQPALCAALSATTFIWELSFPLVLRWPRLRWIYVPTAVAFHLVSQHVLGVGFMYFWPFLFAYVDVGPLLERLKSLRARPIRATPLAAP